MRQLAVLTLPRNGRVCEEKAIAQELEHATRRSDLEGTVRTTSCRTRQNPRFRTKKREPLSKRFRVLAHGCDVGCSLGLKPLLPASPQPLFGFKRRDHLIFFYWDATDEAGNLAVSDRKSRKSLETRRIRCEHPRLARCT